MAPSSKNHQGDDQEEMYDEFGNFIGKLEESSEAAENDAESTILPIDNQGDVEEDSVDEFGEENLNQIQQIDADNATGNIVQFEDRKVYPDASEVYGENVDVRFEDEDEQAIEEALVKPHQPKQYALASDYSSLKLDYSLKYMAELMDNPGLIRNIAITGNLHSGKTTFVDCLIEQTHLDFKSRKADKSVRFSDSLVTEQQRGLSIKSTPISLLLPNSTDKSYIINLIDTPGHTNFNDEVSYSIAVCDGVVLVIDICEGVRLMSEKIVRHCLANRLPIILFLNKIDRFILELKITPQDAFGRMRTIIDEINTIIKNYFGDDEAKCEKYLLHPAEGNVIFGSSEYGFCFSLIQMARIYSHKFGDSFPPQRLTKMLWGDYYFDKYTNKFTKKEISSDENPLQRTFVEFVMSPIYKIFATLVSYEPHSKEVTKLTKTIGVKILRSDYRRSNRNFLRTVMTRFFKKASYGLVDAVSEFVPNPIEAAQDKINLNYFCEDSENLIYKDAIACKPGGELLVHIVKLYPNADASNFRAFGRIYSGTLVAGQTVNVLGHSYTQNDTEDSRFLNITKLWICQGRYEIEVSSLQAGNWVLIEGIDSAITKSATLIYNSQRSRQNASVFKPVKIFASKSVLKISIEPSIPSELPKMLEALRKVSKTYPSMDVRVEESGEHVLHGTGELQLDCILFDIRKVFSDIDIKVSDPVVSFCETVVETSALKCFAQTPNRLNKLTMIAEPLDKGLGEDIESGNVPLQKWSQEQTIKFFTTKYKWDLLAARSVFAFGPDSEFGSNVLINDTLPSEVDKNQLLSIRDNIVQGFQWAVREGPLCDEPMRNVKFKLLDATIAEESIQRSAGQIIPTARRVAYSSFLMATPRMMEPYYVVECIGPVDCVSGIYSVLTARRGHIVSDTPVPGSPLYCVQAYVPAIDSFGLETDLRIHTQGQAFCMSTFNHWQIVPGDPLDKSIVLEVLKPQQPIFLAREFMVKTRRRKGLNEDVSVNKFFDDPMLLELAKQDMIFSNTIVNV